MKKVFGNVYQCIGQKPVHTALLLLFLSPSTIALAQSDTTKKLKEVKVTSSTVPVIQSIVPSQQITANDFSRYSAFNVADAVRNFSGVLIKDYGGIGGLKTISVRGLGANHTSVIMMVYRLTMPKTDRLI